MVVKTFVLDTNIFLFDPKAIWGFGENDLIIPLAVIEELDSMKRLPNDLGRNARTVMRTLSELKEAHNTSFEEGIPLEGGGRLRVQFAQGNEVKCSFPLDRTNKKNLTILAAYSFSSQYERTVFVSKDLATRLKAEAIGMEAQDYQNLKVSYENIYSGINEIKVDKKTIDSFLKDGKIHLEKHKLKANEFSLLKLDDDTQVMGRYDKKNKCLMALKPLPDDLWGVKPRNLQQRCTLELLLRDDIKLITLVGQAGTGKTLLALACALRKVYDETTYNKILISRPIVPLGKDIGYLPGSKEDKLFHWMQPIYDNLEYLTETNGDDENEGLRWIQDSKKIEMEAVTYIRGRTLPNMFIIIDEAQNLTPHEVKTIVSRAGEGTKVVLTGDPSQIDNPYLDPDSNGLTFAVGKFSDHSIFGHMMLDRTERSELAALAATVL